MKDGGAQGGISGGGVEEEEEREEVSVVGYRETKEEESVN